MRFTSESLKSRVSFIMSSSFSAHWVRIYISFGYGGQGVCLLVDIGGVKIGYQGILDVTING